MAPTDGVSVLSELEKIRWKYSWAGDDELRVACPFHEDGKPSVGMNATHGAFQCQAAGCGETGDFLKFLARALHTTRAVIFADLSKRYHLDATKTIDPDVVERHHAAIWQAGPLLKALKERAVDDELIRRYRLGEHQGRITIPIKTVNGLWVNERKYLPGAPGGDKMKNARGRGKIRLYPIEQLKFERIVLCGGEIKAIAATRVLNPLGIGAVSSTGGEGNWEPYLTPEFMGKHVWVCLDIDEEGQKAARERCNMLSRVCSWVGNVLLPLDIDKYPHGDVNDFLAAGLDLMPVLDEAREWEPDFVRVADDSAAPTPATLTTAYTAAMTGKRVRLQGVVAAMADAPYSIPAEVRVNCDKSEKCCAVCPVYFSKEQQPTHKISPESQALLAMVNSKSEDQRKAIMGGVGVPLKCRVVEFEPTSHYHVEEVRLSPSLDISNRSTDRSMQPAIAVGKGLELNETYELTGRMHPHPKNQQATLVLSDYHTVQDALSSYEPQNLAELTAFQPADWSADGIRAKLDDIYADIEANVTRIYQRRPLHLMMDLSWHSALAIQFDGKVDKGTVEVLIVGDSAQGKSETALNLLNHYGLGVKTECKNASVAGLLGGLQQIAGKWFVTWGVLPSNDTRLVVLEEVKGAARETVSKLTDMRSSGIAEIPKIERRRTHARVRLVWLSNPRSDQPLSAYNYGIESVLELIGAPEDVRRFDAVMLVGASEIDRSELNQLRTARPSVPHVYTSELCRSLILWAWTREAAEVVFEPGATEAVLAAATAMGDEFTDIIPIVDSGSMRLKLAKLVVALAARTYSCTDDGLGILVRKSHVEVIVKFLRDTYSSRVFGYADFTKAIKMANQLKNPQQVTSALEGAPLPHELVESLLHTREIDVQDLMDWNAWSRDQALTVLSTLVRNHALQRDGRAYRKSSAFITLLKKLQDDPSFRPRPNFIPETEEF